VEHVGFIGLGIMGSRMAAVLRRAGFEVTVWNRTRARAEAWAAEHGGNVAKTPAQLAERCDVVISMVVDGQQVERVLLGEDGVVEDARKGLLCIDMSTIGPREARSIASRLAEHGVAFLDAPVTG
jgi:3-hydroxyisobutyrate dehydrogenase-like beta-hydroxyacid dehydrogenase